MIKFFKDIFFSQFFKVFSFNGIIVLGKLITSFVVSKVSAIYLGPSGYAIVGNLKNLLQGVLGVTASGFESGLIKYVAEHKKDTKQLNVVVISAFVLSVGISLFVGFCLFLFSNSLSISVLKDASLGHVFKYLAIFLPLISLNFLILYFVNGLQKLKLYTILISISNALNALVTFLGVYFYHLHGALYASIIIPVLSFLFSVCIPEVRYFLFEAIKNIKSVSIPFFKSISTYIAMAIYSSVLLSLSYLLIRNDIISKLDTSTAGLWEAMNKLSSFYMIFFSSLFTLYLLPLLASNTTVKGYNKIMTTYFKNVIPLVIAIFLVIFILRIVLIKLFLTNSFLVIEQYFYLQLLGDFIKIIAFSLAYQFHAKKMVTQYFITDAILYISFYTLSFFCLKHFNLYGVFYAYIISAFLYLIAVCIFVFVNREKYLTSEL